MSELLTIFLFYKLEADFIWWVLLAIVFATEFTLAYRKYLRLYMQSRKNDKG
jgi:hypothetical protein